MEAMRPGLELGAFFFQPLQVALRASGRGVAASPETRECRCADPGAGSHVHHGVNV
jgi:hypothetical protein